MKSIPESQRHSQFSPVSTSEDIDNSIVLVHPENPGPLDQVRDVGLCLENALEIAVAKPWIGRKAGASGPG